VYFGAEVATVAAGELSLATGQRLQAGQIVLAASAGSATLLDGYTITPGRGTVLVTTPIFSAGYNPWHGTWHYDAGYVYWRHLPDGRVLLGGGRNHFRAAETTDSTTTNPEVLAWLEAFANRVLKLPSGWQVAGHWSGTMGFTESNQPFVTEAAPGVWLAAGLGGMGVAIGMQVGKTLAARLH
jgi:gamma-glutamylputrescine oxidase